MLMIHLVLEIVGAMIMILFSIQQDVTLMMDPSCVGDGWCDDNDPLFYTARCNFDDGDCDAINAKFPNCSQYRCPLTYLGDCLCDEKLNNSDCGFDDGNCLIPQPGTCEERPRKHTKDEKMRWVMHQEG